MAHYKGVYKDPTRENIREILALGDAIWSICDKNGLACNDFEEIMGKAMAHYKGVYKDPTRGNIREIISLASYYGTMVIND
jgi:hypothetical protein